MSRRPRRSAYVPQEIEPKWQRVWAERGIMKADDASPKPKYYDLVMYPYPSGDLTVGHARNYVMGDVLARMKRMQGFEVLHPMVGTRSGRRPRTRPSGAATCIPRTGRWATSSR